MEMARAIEALGGLARPAEVGAWVDSISGEVLRRRAAQVQEIESSDGAGRAVPATLAPSPRAAEPTMQLEEPEGLTEQQRPPPPAPSPDPTRPLGVKKPSVRKPLMIASSIVALALLAGVAARLKSAEPTPQPPAEASSPRLPAAAVEAPSEPADPADTTEPPEPAEDSPPREDPRPEPAPVPERRHAKPRRRHVVKADCTPNYYFDADGIKRFKPECL
jgi:hypothetical protein